MFRRKGFFSLILLTSLVILFSCNTKQTKVDAVISADRIYTSDSEFTFAEAVAIKDGKIVAIGTKDDIEDQYTADNVQHYHGYIYPGFIDAHSHFYGYGITKSKVDLKNTFSMEEIIEKVVQYAQTSTEFWITGRGWDQTDWIELGIPNNTKLNFYFPDRPVFIKRVDGHAAIANAKALEMAGITPETKVNGGEIEVINGRLTGLLTDNAMELVDDIVPSPNRQTEIAALLKAQEDCFNVGLTCVCDAGLDLSVIQLIDSLQKTGDLTIRIYAMANPSDENFEYFAKNGIISNDKLQVSSFKFYADGALGSRGAKLKKPYCDQDGHAGVWVTEPENLKVKYEKTAQMGFQANTHCIGDSANRKVLELYGAILGVKNDKRWRIEHAQVVTPEDRKYFEEFSIIPSVQPTHATSDMQWAEQRLCNDRLIGAYAYKSLLSLNGYLPLGTDFPVEDISPLETYYAAVYRQNRKSKPLGGFLPDEALSPKQAIYGMTYWAAKSNFMEKEIGSLEVGKKADFVVLNTDIFNEKYMLNSVIIGTYLDGEKVNK